MSGAGDEPFHWDALVSRILHPIQVAVIEALLWVDLEIAPSEMARLFDGQWSVSHIGYHAKALESLGVLRLVKTEPVRGTTKHYYVLVR